jgi:ATP adenylyltransferase
MKTLWTPWRIRHVLGETPPLPHCLFEPPGEESSNKADLLLFRNKLVVILLNRYPYANGHLLVAPRRHVATLAELSQNEAGILMAAITKATEILTSHLHPDGFNIGCNLGSVAGAGIDDHLHFHIVPRWNGDHNFITVISEIRTIPEHIEQTFDALEPKFSNLHPLLTP